MANVSGQVVIEDATWRQAIAPSPPGSAHWCGGWRWPNRSAALDCNEAASVIGRTFPSDCSGAKTVSDEPFAEFLEHFSVSCSAVRFARGMEANLNDVQDWIWALLNVVQDGRKLFCRSCETRLIMHPWCWQTGALAWRHLSRLCCWPLAGLGSGLVGAICHGGAHPSLMMQR